MNHALRPPVEALARVSGFPSDATIPWSQITHIGLWLDGTPVPEAAVLFQLRKPDRVRIRNVLARGTKRQRVRAIALVAQELTEWGRRAGIKFWYVWLRPEWSYYRPMRGVVQRFGGYRWVVNGDGKDEWWRVDVKESRT